MQMPLTSSSACTTTPQGLPACDAHASCLAAVELSLHVLCNLVQTSNIEGPSHVSSSHAFRKHPCTTLTACLP